MNKIARKLVLSILTVVLTVAALGTTTFAWFTLTNTSVVQPFQAQIVSDTGIEIAIGQPTVSPLDLNWVTTLTTAEITAYIEAEYLGAFKFNMVTTTDGAAFNALGIGALVPTSAGYLELPINFRSNTADRILWDSVTLSSVASNWLSDVSYTHVDGLVKAPATAISIDASNAMRVAILGQLTAGANVVAYEKPAAAGVNIVLGTGGDLSNGGIGDPGAMNYYYEKNAELPFGIATVTTLSTITSLSSNPIIDLTPGSVVDAGQEFYGQVTIRIWLEGWDANAFNSVLTRIIQAQFQFSGTNA
jgi:hypothetical protein